MRDAFSAIAEFYDSVSLENAKIAQTRRSRLPEAEVIGEIAPVECDFSVMARFYDRISRENAENARRRRNRRNG